MEIPGNGGVDPLYNGFAGGKSATMVRWFRHRRLYPCNKTAIPLRLWLAVVVTQG